MHRRQGGPILQFILGASHVLAMFNTRINVVGQRVAIAAMALMVLAILVQVCFRYVIGNPLSWTEEAARFLMLWMAAVVAPTAFRRGGFVAIDMLREALPKAMASVLWLLLLLLALVVLSVAVDIGWSEVTGFSGSFKTASLMTLFTVEFADGFPWIAIDWGWQKMPRNQMMASLLVGAVMMVLMCVELILREIIIIAGKGDALPDIPQTDIVGAE